MLKSTSSHCVMQNQRTGKATRNCPVQAPLILPTPLQIRWIVSHARLPPRPRHPPRTNSCGNVLYAERQKRKKEKRKWKKMKRKKLMNKIYKWLNVTDAKNITTEDARICQQKHLHTWEIGHVHLAPLSHRSVHNGHRLVVCKLLLYHITIVRISRISLSKLQLIIVCMWLFWTSKHTYIDERGRTTTHHVCALGKCNKNNDKMQQNVLLWIRQDNKRYSRLGWFWCATTMRAAHHCPLCHGR